MSKNSDTRTLLVILGVIAALCCGCMCVPLALLGVGLGLPVAAQVQKAADRAKLKPPEGAAFEPAALPTIPNMPSFAIQPPAIQPPVIEPPLPGPSPLVVPPGIAPPGIAPPDSGTPDIPPPPLPDLPATPAFRPRNETSPPGPASEPPATGLAALSERERKNIYFTANIHRRGLESIEKMRSTLRDQGRNTSVLDRSVDGARQRMEMQLDNLCKNNRITRAELEQIIAEGEAQNWPGKSRPK